MLVLSTLLVSSSLYANECSKYFNNSKSAKSFLSSTPKVKDLVSDIESNFYLKGISFKESSFSDVYSYKDSKVTVRDFLTQKEITNSETGFNTKHSLIHYDKITKNIKTFEPWILNTDTGKQVKLEAPGELIVPNLTGKEIKFNEVDFRVYDKYIIGFRETDLIKEDGKIQRVRKKIYIWNTKGKLVDVVSNVSAFSLNSSSNVVAYSQNNRVTILKLKELISDKIVETKIYRFKKPNYKMTRSKLLRAKDNLKLEENQAYFDIKLKGNFLYTASLVRKRFFGTKHFIVIEKRNLKDDSKYEVGELDFTDYFKWSITKTKIKSMIFSSDAKNLRVQIQNRRGSVSTLQVIAESVPDMFFKEFPEKLTTKSTVRLDGPWEYTDSGTGLIKKSTNADYKELKRSWVAEKNSVEKSSVVIPTNNFIFEVLDSKKYSLSQDNRSIAILKNITKEHQEKARVDLFVLDLELSEVIYKAAFSTKFSKVSASVVKWINFQKLLVSINGHNVKVIELNLNNRLKLSSQQLRDLSSLVDAYKSSKVIGLKIKEAIEDKGKKVIVPSDYILQLQSNLKTLIETIENLKGKIDIEPTLLKRILNSRLNDNLKDYIHRYDINTQVEKFGPEL